MAMIKRIYKETKTVSAERGITSNVILLFSLCLLIFIDSIGVGLVYSIMPQIFLDSVNGLTLEKLGVSRNVLYGLAFSFFSFASFFGIPILGILSDRYGRKKLMLIALLGIITGHAFSIFAICMHNPIIFLIARIIEGFFSGTYVIANAIVSDISTNVEKKLFNFRWVTFALVAGFTLGPFLGVLGSLIIIKYSLVFPFVIALILAVINWVLLFLFLKETLSSDKRINNLQHIYIFRKLISTIYSIKARSIRYLAVGYTFFQFSFGLFLPFIGLFLTKKYGYSSVGIGLFFMSMGITISISISLLQPIINKHINYQKQLSLSLLLMGIILLVQAIILTISNFIKFSSLYYIWLLSIIFFALLPLVVTNFLTIFSESVSTEHQGRIMGETGQINAVTAFISGVMIGYLMDINEIIIFAVSGIGILFSYYFLYSHLSIMPSEQLAKAKSKNLIIN